jgi:hypothetical protein
VKRLHVHVAVDDIDRAVPSDRALFGEAPQVLRSDDAKWMLEDPRLNFAISARRRRAGLDHLGMQVDADAELAEACQTLSGTGTPVVEEEGVTCCYARGNKTRVADPAGLLWETFHAVGPATVCGQTDPKARALAGDSDACCAPPA